MSRDDPDPDRHPWVVMPPEKPTPRMTSEELANEIAQLKDRNNRSWAAGQDRIAERARRRRAR